jgi:high-affinity Fe2+/Pb2+ permease
MDFTQALQYSFYLAGVFIALLVVILFGKGVSHL